MAPAADEPEESSSVLPVSGRMELFIDIASKTAENIHWAFNRSLIVLLCWSQAVLDYENRKFGFRKRDYHEPVWNISYLCDVGAPVPKASQGSRYQRHPRAQDAARSPERFRKGLGHLLGRGRVQAPLLNMGACERILKQQEEERKHQHKEKKKVKNNTTYAV